MSEFETHLYSARAYSAEECISFSQCPRTHLADVEREMAFHRGVRHVQVSNLTQSEFDDFVKNYGDEYESIYFFQNPKVKDLSALAGLRNVKYLLFYNCRGASGLWDLSRNVSLKGILIGESRKMIHDLTPIAAAPALEELLLTGGTSQKHTVQSLEPLRACPALKRVMLDCRTERGDFDPAAFARLEVLRYHVDGWGNMA